MTVQCSFPKFIRCDVWCCHCSDGYWCSHLFLKMSVLIWNIINTDRYITPTHIQKSSLGSIILKHPEERSWNQRGGETFSLHTESIILSLEKGTVRFRPMAWGDSASGWQSQEETFAGKSVSSQSAFSVLTAQIWTSSNLLWSNWSKL